MPKIKPVRYLDLAYEPGNTSVLTICSFANEYMLQRKQNWQEKSKNNRGIGGFDNLLYSLIALQYQVYLF